MGSNLESGQIGIYFIEEDLVVPIQGLTPSFNCLVIESVIIYNTGIKSKKIAFGRNDDEKTGVINNHP